MLKFVKLRNKTKQDVRFIDAETYHSQRVPSRHRSSSSIPPSAGLTGQPVFPNTNVFSEINSDLFRSTPGKKQSFYRSRSGEPLMTSDDADEHILVEDRGELPQMLVEESFDLNASSSVIGAGSVEDIFDLFVAKSERAQGMVENQLEKKKDYLGPNYLCENSLGVFSDSKMYSALIRKELSAYQLDVRHFNHPKTFKPARYDFFDRISAWVLFLSDDCDENFIDHFLDRYSDKPALFLCPKMSRKNATDRIREFVDNYQLEKQIELPEVNEID